MEADKTLTAANTTDTRVERDSLSDLTNSQKGGSVVISKIFKSDEEERRNLLFLISRSTTLGLQDTPGKNIQL